MAERTGEVVVSSSHTLQEDHQSQRGPEPTSTVRLRLKKPEKKKKVGWSEGTVDNEEMDKKKSKCCCIYKKPRAFGESSSESEDDCDDCPGHSKHPKDDQEPSSLPPDT